MLTGIRDYLTYHHIVKREDGGPRDIENGGIVFSGIHQWHHNWCELYDRVLYIKTNGILREYKELVVDPPYWFNDWERDNNIFYLRKGMEYYKEKHNPKMVKVLRREYEKRF